MSSVFISYSSKDRETALKVKAALQSHGISVTIDQKGFKGKITECIERSVRENKFTLTIISEHSLNSAWVSQEGITTIYGEKFTGEQKYIACYLDEEFLQDDYIVRASAMINAKIQRLEKLKKQADREGAIPKNLESTINRLKYHRGNLGDILDRLQGDRTFDIRDQQFENSISQIVEIILPDSFIDIRPLELQYLEQLKKRGIEDQTKYTPLGGRATEIPMIRDSFDLRPCESINIGKIGGGRLEPRRFDDAVGEILALKRAVVLGEPGAGKSTTLWKLVGDLREKARLDRSAPIPLFIALGKWTAEDEGFAHFLCRELGELGKHLDRLLRENRACLFLDGLNELPAAQRKEKTKQIRSYIEREELSDLTAIISCRQLDYTENDLEMHRVEIVPLDPIRIKEFIHRYLGEQRGEALFWRLAGPDAEKAFRQFCQEFNERLPDLETIFWDHSQLPDEIKWGWNNNKWTEWLALREHPSSLMVLARNPFMLVLLYSAYQENSDSLPQNRSGLFSRFVEILFNRELKAKNAVKEDFDLLADGISQVAYRMQTRRTRAKDGDALTVLPRHEVADLLDQRILSIATRASILSPGEEVRFTHQLLQEYFAARQMDAEIKAGKLVASNLWPAASWWERNNWEEATVLLAGFYDNDCTEVINWVADANPEVAAMCIKKSGAICPPATLEDLRRRWLPRLTDLQRDPDPRARAAVGRALGMTGLDNRPGVGVTNKSGVVLPDIDWVDIEGGEFKYGDDNPRQRLTLESFHISRYPITYRQFQLFIDDPEGMRDDRWLAGLDCDMKKEQEPGEQAFPFDNHPRETVSWYQAIAFCRWLSWRLGGEYDLDHVDRWMIRLPTEFEWERAARGRKGRKYAYGDKYDPSLGNTDDTGIGQTSAVGIFPHGASPDKVVDMTGNVWEWCLGTYQNSQIDPANQNLAAGGSRLVRGGSWYFDQVSVRAAYRINYHPANRYNDLGVRVVFGLRPPSLKH